MNRFKYILVAIALLNGSISFSQGVGINVTGANPNAAAVVDMVSTNKGFLTPRMTEAQRNAIVAPATGLLIYQLDNNAGFRFYDGTQWVFLRGRVSVPGKVNVLPECAGNTLVMPAAYPGFTNTVTCATGTGTVTWGAGLFDQTPTVNISSSLYPVPPPAPSNYCIPLYSAPCGTFIAADQIEQVQVQTGPSAAGPWTTVMNNNNSGCNLQPGNYIAYPTTAYTCTLPSNNGAPGCTNNWYRVNMRSSVEWNDWCQFFIDFNQDGDFVDAGEWVLTHGQSSGALLNSPGLQIPVASLNGNTVMRCRSLWINSTNPCQSATFGETEDYTITITCATSGPAPEVATHCQVTNATTTSFTYRCNLLSGVAVNPSINFELLENE